MELTLKDLNILVIGGDHRELELFSCLQQGGAHVSMYGFNDGFPVKNRPRGLAQELFHTHVIITPLNGIEADGLIYTPLFHVPVNVNDDTFLENIQPGTLFVAGYINPAIKKTLQQNNVIVCETRHRDEISILNAIPTAEGAIQAAMERTEITIHNSQCFVLGFGRCGKVLAGALQGLGADVTVVARRDEVLAWALASCMHALPLPELAQRVHRADIIFNTIPAVVVDESVLCRVKQDVLIIDIATHPGGIDFAAAERLGVNTIVLPGLPGKIAPKTAGRILCRVYPSLILSALKGGKSLEFTRC